MTIKEQGFLELLRSDDLIAIGDGADAVRKRLHPAGIVSYTRAAERDPTVTAEVILSGTEDDISRLEALSRSTFPAFRVSVQTGITAAEYLKLLAIARIYTDHIPNLEVASDHFGLKVCQLALRFGANDLGPVGPKYSEEKYKTLIREAGFLPKQRDEKYLSYSLL